MGRLILGVVLFAGLVLVGNVALARPVEGMSVIVPEPVSTVLFLTGGAALVMRRLTRKK